MLLGTQHINEAGHLAIGGLDAARLAAQFGTPLYVLDEQELRRKCRAYLGAFQSRYPSVGVYYAGKAALPMAIAAIVAREGLGLDVASLGELYVALESGFPAKRIALHGSNKSAEEMEAAVHAGIGHIVLDNFRDMDLLAQVQSSGGPMDVLIRVAPGVDPRTHRLIRTGQADTKFGFPLEDGSAIRAVRLTLSMPKLRFRGLHCHVGSQLLDAETHQEAARIMAKLMQRVQQETGATVEEINIGGGLGARYTEEDLPPPVEEFADLVVRSFTAALDEARLPRPKLLLEPGRSLVAEAGVALYTVGAIKTVPIQDEPGFRTYVSIDGGLSDNPRPQMYQARYTCLLANRAREAADSVVTIAGKHCETDILIWNARLPKPSEGDLLAVLTSGAYQLAMASNYNRALRPALVIANEGQADLIVERETLADLTRRERIPGRLRFNFSEPPALPNSGTT